MADSIEERIAVNETAIRGIERLLEKHDQKINWHERVLILFGGVLIGLTGVNVDSIVRFLSG